MMYRVTLPFIAIQFVILLLVTYFPQLSLWFVDVMNVR